MKRYAMILAACLGIGMSMGAFAANGYVTRSVNMRAGPDIRYPVIMRLRAGTAVSIQGCIDAFLWCDVIALGERGWIAGRYLQYDYDNRRVLVPAYGTVIGIPIITFVFDSYWDSYYRSRPWYRDRSRWQHHPGYGHAAPHPPVHRPPVQPKPPAHRPPPRPQPPVTRPLPPKPQAPATRPPPSRPKPVQPPARPTPPVAGGPGNVRPTPSPTPQARPHRQPKQDRDKDKAKDKDGGG